MTKTRNRGFTLIEVLVVIAILAVLATTVAVMAPKLLKKGAQAKSVGAMRQMMSSLELYATDNSKRIPPPVTPEDQSEAKQETYWFTYLEQQISGGELEVYLKDKWWKDNKNSTFINPMLPKKDLKHSSTGYAMNAALGRNIALTRGEDMDLEDSKNFAVNLSTIRKPESTPIVIPHWTYFYVGDKAETANKKFTPFLVNGRIPVLFLDSHIESLTPLEYTNKGLHLVPKPDASASEEEE